MGADTDVTPASSDLLNANDDEDDRDDDELELDDRLELLVDDKLDDAAEEVDEEAADLEAALEELALTDRAVLIDALLAVDTSDTSEWVPGVGFAGFVLFLTSLGLTFGSGLALGSGLAGWTGLAGRPRPRKPGADLAASRQPSIPTTHRYTLVARNQSATGMKKMTVNTIAAMLRAGWSQRRVPSGLRSWYQHGCATPGARFCSQASRQSSRSRLQISVR